MLKILNELNMLLSSGFKNAANAPILVAWRFIKNAQQMRGVI